MRLRLSVLAALLGLASAACTVLFQADGTLGRCGDGRHDPGEECDTGSPTGYGCDAKCRVEAGFSCEDVVSPDNPDRPHRDGTDSGATVNVCFPTLGDGRIVSGEDCDDGNKKSGDGCLDGFVEDDDFGGWTCFGEPSACRRSCTTTCSADEPCCGPLQNTPCCTPLAVPSEVVPPADDASAQEAAAVPGFYLDEFEVTVSRFNQFVKRYHDWRMAGHPSNDEDWKGNVDNLPSADESNKLCDNSSCPSPQQVGPTLPITHVRWDVAAAFCLWDGGRLPTSEEWQYAAQGGSEKRVFPWGDATPKNADGNPTAEGAAVCGAMTAVEVGSIPAGRGRWGHRDLAGNVWEWTDDLVVDGGSHNVSCADAGAFQSTSRKPCDAMNQCDLAEVGFRCLHALERP